MIQNHWVVPRSAFHPTEVNQESGICGVVVAEKLFSVIGLVALGQLNAIHKKGL